jgi:hypothetical protein
MPLLTVAAGVALVLLLVLVVRLDAFLALLLAALAVGLLNGMGPLAVLDAVLRGIGATMGNVVLVLVFGAMLGKLLEESGAAQTLGERLTRAFGPGRVPLAMAATGLLVGLPMLYNAGFLVLIPLVYALGAATGLPLLYLGVPLAAALSVAHGFLPPHPRRPSSPSPTAPTCTARWRGARRGGAGRARGRRAVRRAAAPRPLGAPGAVGGGGGRRSRRGAGRARSAPGVRRESLHDARPRAADARGRRRRRRRGTAGLDPVRDGAAFAPRLLAAVPDDGLRALVVAASSSATPTSPCSPPCSSASSRSARAAGGRWTRSCRRWRARWGASR